VVRPYGTGSSVKAFLIWAASASARASAVACAEIRDKG
jgi:hypothetical protein